MVTDELVVYEMWDLQRPVVPPRSWLYALEPVGLGSPWVESLSGYVARLAESHSVSVRALVFHEVAPLLGRPRLTKTVNNGLSTFWVREAQALNGTRTLAQDWVRILESLTLRNDLRWLTLLPWTDVLSNRGLLRSTRAWCPECYTTWQTEERTVYEPLLWALQVVDICPQHRRRLCLQCPICQQPLPLLNSRTRPGYCSKCGSWLGASLETDGADGEPLSAEEMLWHAWIVERVGELLAYASSLAVAPRWEHVTEVVSAWRF